MVKAIRTNRRLSNTRGSGGGFTAEPNRMAGEKVPKKVSDLIDEVRGLIDEKDENNLEALTQFARLQTMLPNVNLEGVMAGTSRIAEADLARQLYQTGTVGPIRRDDIAFKDMMGYKGQTVMNEVDRQKKILPGSRLGITLDVTPEQRQMLAEGSVPVFDRTSSGGKPVLTEYPTREGLEYLYREWLKSPRSETARKTANYKPDWERDDYLMQQFNEALGEYTGQQALRTLGFSSVSDADRSSRQLTSGPTITTRGTDRLIENSRGLTTREKPGSGDYRAYDPEGELYVGDYQTGESSNQINVQIMKALQMDKELKDSFEKNFVNTKNLIEAKGIKPTTSKILKTMEAKGMLPATQTDEYHLGRMAGMRAGKLLSGTQEYAENNPDRQYRYDGILYGIGDRGDKLKIGGHLPKRMLLADNSRVNRELPQVATPRVQGKTIYARVRPQDLIDRGALIDITQDPRIQQLLDRTGLGY